jgi:putative ABC transport system ATP-binding protein
MINCSNLTKIYGRGTRLEICAVKNATLTIPAGSLTVVSGPSGSGKSTLLGMLALLIRPTKGEVFYNGDEVTAFSDSWRTRVRKENLSFIFQQFNLLSQYKVWENVAMPLLCRDIAQNSRRKMAVELLSSLGLERRADFKIAQLSVGEQQRVAIARALITDPRTIFADEPTASVDSETASAIIDMFLELKDEGKSILAATHNPTLRERADLRIVLKDGVIVNQGGISG